MAEEQELRGGHSAFSRRLALQAILGVLAIATTVVYTSLGIRYPITGGGETVAVTENLVRDGSFANPFAAGKTGPSAFLPPAYPLFRAGLVKVFGERALFVALLVTLLVHGLHAALLPTLSQTLIGRTGPGVWAAGLAIVLPLFDVIPWEAMFVATGLIAIYLYLGRVLASGRSGFLGGAGAGFAAALLLLTNPVSLLAFGPWLVVLTWRRRREPHIGRMVAGFAIALCLGCLPWTLRNYQQFGRFVFVRDNFGLVLYASNNDCAAPSLIENLRNGCNDRFHPIANRNEVELIQRVGEVEYNRDRLRVALEWIRRQPRRFVELSGWRFLDFWFPREAYSFWLVTALAIAGTVLMIRRRVSNTWLLVAVCALNSALYCLAEVTPRYRYPIMWISLLQAGYLLDRILAAVHRPPSRRMKVGQTRAFHAGE